MHDQFLISLRREPPAQFSRELKRKLQAQDAAAQRRSWASRTRTILFLIVGSAAFASGILVVEHRFAEQADSAQPQSQLEQEGQAAPPAYSPRSLHPTVAPFGDSAANGLSAPSTRASGHQVGATSTSPEQAMAGAPLRARRSAKIATSQLNDALVRHILESVQSRRPNPTFQIERIDADAAFAALCARGDAATFDLIVTSRRITHAEFNTCRRNGTTRITESKVGYQAVVLTSARDSAPLKLSPTDVYLGLAQQIPDWVEPTRFIDNPAVSWDEIGKFEYRPIMVLGPASKTPLRSLFEALVLEPGCNVHRALQALQTTDQARYAELCHSLRGPRWYTDVEQNGLLIPQYLWTDLNSLVVMDHEFYIDNRAQLAGSALLGPEPSEATFANGTYPFARPIYLYADETRLARAVGVYEAMSELQSIWRYRPPGFGISPLGAQEAEQRRNRRTSILAESDLITKQE